MTGADRKAKFGDNVHAKMHDMNALAQNIDWHTTSVYGNMTKFANDNQQRARDARGDYQPGVRSDVNKNMKIGRVQHKEWAQAREHTDAYGGEASSSSSGPTSSSTAMVAAVPSKAMPKQHPNPEQLDAFISAAYPKITNLANQLKTRYEDLPLARGVV